jgi:hypothetical protein
MVWAFDLTHGALVRIGAGQADRLRQRARDGELVCPVGDCSAPAMRTRRGYRNRFGTFVPDGFRHHHAPDPEHHPETFAHITGKLLVARWLTAAGWTEVHVERRDTQYGRTPDVSARLGVRRLAVEVQYAQLRTDEWQARTEALRASGFEVIWLWGGNAPAPSGVQYPNSLRAVQTELVRNGEPVLWLDPDAAAVGISAGIRNQKPGGRARARQVLIEPEPGDSTVQIMWAPIWGCRPLAGGGLWHPRRDQLRRAGRWLHQVRLTQLLACLDAHLRNRQDRDALRAARLVPHRTPAQRRADRPNETPKPWRVPPVTSPAKPTTVSDVDRAVLGRAGLTGIMAATDSSDEYVYQPVNTWHPVVALWLLRHRPGTRISLDALTDFICQHFVGDLRNARFAYDGQLRRLAEAGWIDRGPGHLILLRSLEDAPNSPNSPADDDPAVPPVPDQLGLFDA